MIIIKIGGGEKINIEGIANDISSLKGEKIIIVHGANELRNKIAKQLGNPIKTITSVKGYSSVFSDENTIDAIMMAYSGLKNKKIVELLQKKGINAVGLSGLDGKLVQGIRNKGIRVKENDKVKILRDFSGKPKKVNKDLLQLLLDNNYLPVICIPIIDENNFAINSENDDIVRVLQQAFNAATIINLIEAPGFLTCKDDDSSLLKNISKNELEEREQQVQGRIKRKLLSIRKMLESSKTKIIISDGRVENPIKDALDGKGTIIQ